MSLPGRKVSSVLLGKSGGQSLIAPQGAEQRGQSGDGAPLCVCLAVKAQSDGCKERCCIRAWNVVSVSQGKLDVVKQETARLISDTLGMGELKWMGMGKFNSDDHGVYCHGQESPRINGIALIANQRV